MGHGASGFCLYVFDCLVFYGIWDCCGIQTRRYAGISADYEFCKYADVFPLWSIISSRVIAESDDLDYKIQSFDLWDRCFERDFDSGASF